jgi:hypothetical protein
MKMKSGWLVVLMMGVLAGSLFAQTGVTIGANYWNAKPDLGLGLDSGVKFNPMHMFGPYVNIRSGKFSFGGSLFLGTLKIEATDIYEYEVSMKRSDINLSLGYSIVKGITLFGALKTFTNKLEDWKVNGQSIGGDSENQEKGLLYGGGIFGVLPFSGSPLFLFGSLAYLTGSVTYEGELGEVDYDRSLASLTAGIGYRMTPQLNLLLGYRSDASGDPKEDEEENLEKFRGIIVTIGYTLK